MIHANTLFSLMWGVSFDQHIHINDLLDVISETEDISGRDAFQRSNHFFHPSAFIISQITGEGRGHAEGAVITVSSLEAAAGVRRQPPAQAWNPPAAAYHPGQDRSRAVPLLSPSPVLCFKIFWLTSLR